MEFDFFPIARNWGDVSANFEILNFGCGYFVVSYAGVARHSKGEGRRPRA